MHKKECTWLCYITEHTTWHSAVCESLEANYRYAMVTAYKQDYITQEPTTYQNYARAICNLIQEQYDDQPAPQYFDFTNRMPNLPQGNGG